MSDTIKIKFCLSNGLSGHREEVETFDREEWDSMSEGDKEEILRDWAHNFIEYWFEEVKDR